MHSSLLCGLRQVASVLWAPVSFSVPGSLILTLDEMKPALFLIWYILSPRHPVGIDVFGQTLSPTQV